MADLVTVRVPVVVCAVTTIVGCEAASAPSTTMRCEGYASESSSAYVLPYAVGREHRVSQGNCTTASHQGTLRYSYDLEMPFGSVVTAARDGVVHAMRVTQPAGSRGLTASNWLQIRHADGMFSEYIHLAEQGHLVELGQTVRAGDPVAITGDTGDIGTYPHLHFDINPCANNLACDTRPVTFRNTSPHPRGLEGGKFYPAFGFDSRADQR